MVANVKGQFGRIDICVNSAGINVRKPALDMSPAEFKRVLETNLTGSWLTARAAGAVMVEQGRGKVINLASIYGHVAIEGNGAYAASKGGIVQITKVLAVEWAPKNVQVNCLAANLRPHRPYRASAEERGLHHRHHGPQPDAPLRRGMGARSARLSSSRPTPAASSPATRWPSTAAGRRSSASMWGSPLRGTLVFWRWQPVAAAHSPSLDYGLRRRGRTRSSSMRLAVTARTGGDKK